MLRTSLCQVVRKSRLPKRSFSGSSAGMPAVDEATPQQIHQDHAHCVNLVRERDREGYCKFVYRSTRLVKEIFCRQCLTLIISYKQRLVCGLLMPANSQKAYFALRALNVEIASIKEKIHGEPGSLALQLRMQWWRDAVAEIYGDVPSSSGQGRLSVSCWHSPIVRGMYRGIQQSQPLTRRFLERLIDSRQADLDILERSTLQETVDYAEESVSSLLYLSLELLGVREDAADEVASHAGVGIGVTTALRAVPWQNGATVPTELLRRPDSSIVRLIQKEEQDEQVWQQAIAEMVDTAAFHLARAQALQSQVPRAGRLALLPVVPAMHYLEALATKGNNVLQPDDAAERRLGLLLRMGRTWLTGVF